MVKEGPIVLQPAGLLKIPEEFLTILEPPKEFRVPNFDCKLPFTFCCHHCTCSKHVELDKKPVLPSGNTICSSKDEFYGTWPNRNVRGFRRPSFGRQKSVGGLEGVRHKRIRFKSVGCRKSLENEVGASIPF